MAYPTLVLHPSHTVPSDKLFFGPTGFTVRVNPKATIKSAASLGPADDAGGRYLVGQALLMRNAGMPLFPKILELGVHGYTMETLRDIDWVRTPPAPVLIALKGLLKKHVWYLPAAAPPSWPTALLRDIDRICTEVDLLPVLRRRVIKLLDRLAALDGLLTTGTIHGAAKLEHCMARTTGALPEPALIAPEPWSHAGLPPFRAVDIGALLLSAIGYEHILLGTDHFPHPLQLGSRSSVDLIENILSDQDPGDTRAARIFLVIHVVRLLPKHTKLRPVFIKLLENLLGYIDVYL